MDPSGDIAIAGAPIENSKKGTATIFERSGDSWTSTTIPPVKITASDGASLDYFGIGVGIEG